jgi:hypothetical protein
MRPKLVPGGDRHHMLCFEAARISIRPQTLSHYSKTIHLSISSSVSQQNALNWSDSLLSFDIVIPFDLSHTISGKVFDSDKVFDTNPSFWISTGYRVDFLTDNRWWGTFESAMLKFPEIQIARCMIIGDSKRTCVPRVHSKSYPATLNFGQRGEETVCWQLLSYVAKIENAEKWIIIIRVALQFVSSNV